MFSLQVIYIMTPLFFMILIFGERSSRSYSFVIFVSCILNLLTDETVTIHLPLVERERLFILETKVSILWDSACALILITSKLFSQGSGKQAILLSFAVLCHIMVAYGWSISARVWYVELIISISLLQILVTWNDSRTAFSELRGFTSRSIYYLSCNVKGWLKLEKGK